MALLPLLPVRIRGDAIPAPIELASIEQQCHSRQ
jgi:hypothetical protein